MPWGGTRLRNWLQSTIWPTEEKVGEAWLLSDHALHQSMVLNGPLAGMTLGELMATRGQDLLGFSTPRFPLLIKLLDAAENLSVQVHPDNEQARQWAPKEGGKSEAWYVLESSPDAAIYLGLKTGLNRATFLRELGNGTLQLCLNHYVPRPGDCFNVPAGSVHALGGGTVVLEVQQTSDATFRLFDWNRVDASGQPRPLHLEAGLACIKENLPGIGKQQPRTGPSGEVVLVETPYFHLTRLTQPSKLTGPSVIVNLGEFVALQTDSMMIPLKKGELCFIPAHISVGCTWQGEHAELMFIKVQPP